jgi:hypothetical protein
MNFGTVADDAEFMWVISGTFRASTLEVGQMANVQNTSNGAGATRSSFSTENTTPADEGFLEISGYSDASCTCNIKSVVVETF